MDNAKLLLRGREYELPVVVGSEDGFLYCLEHDGTLRWSVCGGPRERLVLGHERLISAWPVTATPAVHEGKVYFAAGCWPVNGVYHHAVDLKTGTIEWDQLGGQLSAVRRDEGRGWRALGSGVFFRRQV